MGSGAGIWYLGSGRNLSRIQGSSKHRIPDPVPQRRRFSCSLPWLHSFQWKCNTGTGFQNWHKKTVVVIWQALHIHGVETFFPPVDLLILLLSNIFPVLGLASWGGDTGTIAQPAGQQRPGRLTGTYSTHQRDGMSILERLPGSTLVS